VALGTQLWHCPCSCAAPPALVPASSGAGCPRQGLIASWKMTQTLPISTGKTCRAGESKRHGGLAEGAGSCLHPAILCLPPVSSTPFRDQHSPTCCCGGSPAAGRCRMRPPPEVSPGEPALGAVQGGVPVPSWDTPSSACPQAGPKAPSPLLSPQPGGDTEQLLTGRRRDAGTLPAPSPAPAASAASQTQTQQ